MVSTIWEEVYGCTRSDDDVSMTENEVSRVSHDGHAGVNFRDMLFGYRYLSFTRHRLVTYIDQSISLVVMMKVCHAVGTLVILQNQVICGAQHDVDSEQCLVSGTNYTSHVYTSFVSL